MSRVVRSVAVLIVCAVLLICAVWVFAAAPFLRDARLALFEPQLERALGTGVTVAGDVEVSLFPQVSVVARDVRVPMRANPDIDVVRVDTARFGIVPNAALAFPNISGEGIRFTFLTDEDSTPFLSASGDIVTDLHTAAIRTISFLGRRDVSFKDVSIRIENTASGFTFDFDLDDLTVEHPQGEMTAVLASSGRVNGQPFAAEGTFAMDGAFDIDAQVGAMDVQLEGDGGSINKDGDVSARLTVQSDDLNNLFEVLNLKADYEGEFRVTADFDKRGTSFEFSDLEATTQLEDGRRARVRGRIAGNPALGPASAEVDVTSWLDLRKTGEKVQRAVYLGDIRPRGVKADIIAAENLWTIRQVELRTNAFEEDLRKIGPFRIGDIRRNPDGRLQLSDFSFQIGANGHSFVRLQGDIDDLLNARDYRLSGDIDIPMARVLPSVPAAEDGTLGRLTGLFEVVEQDGRPVLADFDLQSADTSLWRGHLFIDSPDLTAINDAELDASFEVPDLRAFHKALKLSRAGSGAFGLSLTASVEDQSMRMGFGLTMEKSEATAKLEVTSEQGWPRVAGTIDSPTIRLEDIEHTVAFFRDLAEVTDDLRDQIEHSVTGDNRSAENNSWRERLKTALGVRKSATHEEGNSIKLSGLLDPLGSFGAGSMDVKVDVARVTGLTGLDAIDGDIKLNDGILSFSPIDLALGRGHARANAKVDLVQEPERVHVWGYASGWELDQVFKETGLKIDADGTVHARFDVSGHYHSVTNFVDTLRGRVTVGLEDGEIGTSLLELSGLGVVPWLFSQELANGASHISCIKAPLRFSNGKITSQDMVLETKRVQVVATGEIDYRHNRINIKVDPRSLGHPLSKSHWPFKISGKATAPNVSVHYGRVKRRSPQQLAMPVARAACVPDVKQLRVTRRAPRG